MIVLAPPAPRKVHKEIKLHRAQAAFRRSPALFRGFVGGRGAGKTWIGAYDLIRRAKPGRTYLVGSPTGVIMGDTTFPTFKQIGRDLNVIGPNSIRLSPYPTITLTTGAEVRFRTAEDPEKMRGPNLSGVWLDEASLMPREAFTINIAALREAGEQGWMSSTFTPKGLSHWTYEQFGEQKPDTELFHATTHENPFLPQVFATKLEEQYGQGSWLASQELGGKFLSPKGVEWPPQYFEGVWADSVYWPRRERIVVSALALDPAQGKGERGKYVATKEEPKACYVSFVLVEIDADGLIWVDAWMSKEWDANAMATIGLRICKERQPLAWSVETNGGQEFLKDVFFREAEKLKQACPLWGIHNYVDKEVRIRMLGPFLGQRRFRFRKDSPGCKLLINQLREFPVSEYRDGPDALEMAIRMCDTLLGQNAANGAPIVLRA